MTNSSLNRFCLTALIVAVTCGLRVVGQPADDLASAGKLLVLGDSIACGVGSSSQDRRFTSLVRNALNQAGERWQEINLAISGSCLVDTAWPHRGASAYPHLLSRVVEQHPDILIIQHGTNDNTLGHSLGEFLWAYRRLVSAVKEQCPKTKIVCMTICPLWGIERGDGSWLEQVNAGIQEIAARENTLLAQTYLKLHRRRGLFPDGIHPNDEGHQIMADSVLDALNNRNIQSVDRFDFTVCNAGRYRICGYEINIAAPKTQSGDQWLEIYQLSGNGFVYKSELPIEILTPFKMYSKNFTLHVSTEGGEKSILKGTCHPYFGYGKITLPATDNLSRIVTIHP